MNAVNVSRLARDERDARARDQACPRRGLRPPRARRQAPADARLHLHLPRHDRPAAGAERRHLPASRRGRRRALAAEAAARRGAARAGAAGPARPAAGRAGRAPAGLPPRSRARAGGAPAHAAGRGASPTAPRSSTTASPSSRASTSPAGSGRSRSSCSTATSAPCGGSRSSCARRARGRRVLSSPKLYRALDLAGTPETRTSTKGTPPVEALGNRAPGRLPGAARARPGDAPRRRSRRTSTSFASRRGGCGRSCAPRDRSSTGAGPSRCARSSAGSAGTSGRRATSTSCSAVSATRSRRSAQTARARQGCSRRSRKSARPPIATWPRRSRATATTRCSTGSKQPARRRRAGRTHAREDLQEGDEAHATEVRRPRRGSAGRRAA